MTKPRAARTRANGDGSVYPFGNRWRVAVPYPDTATGKTKYRVRIVDTKREADRLLADMVRDRDAGLDLGRATVQRFLEGWVRNQRMKVKASTLRSHELHIRRHINPALGRIQLAKLSPTDVENMMSGMVERGLSPQTARHVRTTLRKALGMALRDGLVTRNAAASVELPRLDHREVTSLTAAETSALIATCAAANTTVGDAVIVAVTTGLRQGELLGLSLDDLELDGPEPALHVRHSLTRSHEGGFEIGDTKTKKSRRRVDLAPDAVAAFRRQRVRQLEVRLRAGTSWHDTGLVFTNELGGHLMGWNLTKPFHALANQAGVRPCRFHDLRHTAASLWLQAGEPLKVVSEALGHGSIAITADTYAHVAPAQRRRLADVMAAITAGNGA